MHVLVHLVESSGSSCDSDSFGSNMFMVVSHLTFDFQGFATRSEEAADLFYTLRMPSNHQSSRRMDGVSKHSRSYFQVLKSHLRYQMEALLVLDS